MRPGHFAALLKTLQITAISRTKNFEKSPFSFFGKTRFVRAPEGTHFWLF
jgi:hypothetical protein